MSQHMRWLALIVLVTAFSIWVALPDSILTTVAVTCYSEDRPAPTQGIHLDFNGDCIEDVQINVRQSLGLDLVGGLRVLLQAELPPDAFTVQDLREAANNVARRVNALGVAEPLVQVQGNNRILVELPGISNPREAIDTIRQTALLEFVNFSGLPSSTVAQLEGEQILTTEQLAIQQARQSEDAPEQALGTVSPATGLPFETVLTGAGLQSAAAVLEQGRWIISFELTPEGAAVFGPYTAANLNQPMAIVLDGRVLSAPYIRARLDTGGIIEGDFTEEDARTLALQLRSGALPIPLTVTRSERVGATLGQESVNLSVRAGLIGVMVVLTFMLVYYRVPGIAADFALLVFIVLNFAIFKLIPVTLTLPAIIGFLISIGTAVDGNILIFERIKEELRAGRKIDEAVDIGFGRAWQSIRDSNLSTIIICTILFLFGQTPGASIVAGFAVTLGLGLIINLFTAVIVTRTFLGITVAGMRSQLDRRQWLMGI